MRERLPSAPGTRRPRGRRPAPAGRGISSSALQTPVGYAGRYDAWNLNLDGVGSADSPWDFGGAGQYPILVYGGLDALEQLRLPIWSGPPVGVVTRTPWSVRGQLTRAPNAGFIRERSDDGVTGWEVIQSSQSGIGKIRRGGGSWRLFVEPFAANKRFRVRGRSVARGWIPSPITAPATPWRGPTAALPFVSDHTAPRVGQAIAISGSNAVKWIRCNDTADNGCDVIALSATSYTPVAADQGKYLYAYRY